MNQRFILDIRDCYQHAMSKIWESVIGVKLPLIHRREYVKQLFKIMTEVAVYEYTSSYKEVLEHKQGIAQLQKSANINFSHVYVESIATSIMLEAVCDYISLETCEQTLGMLYIDVYLQLWLKVQNLRRQGYQMQLTYINSNEVSLLIDVYFKEEGVEAVW